VICEGDEQQVQRDEGADHDGDEEHMAGAVVIASHGTPRVGEALLLAGGAIAAYGTLQLLARRAEEPTKRQLGASPRPLRADAIHVSAIGLAIGAAALVSLIGAWVAWFLAGFTATAAYLLVLAVELLVQEREQNDGQL
jgi:hypothetical protein